MNDKHKMDIIDIMGLVVVLIGSLILSPILSYSLYRFHKIRKASIMKFRNLTLIYLINILVLCTILLVSFFVCSIDIWHIIDNTPWNPYNISIAPFIIWYIYLLFAIKTWLLHFEQKYHLSLVHLTWKKLINQYAKSWHISTRHKFGNYKYLLKFGLIPYFIYIIIETTINVQLQRSNYSTAVRIVSTFINWILTAFPLLFSCAIYYRFHSKGFKDIYKISNEIKYQCIVIIICLILNTICVGIYLYYSISIRIQCLLNLILTYILLFGIAIFTTTYPVYIYHKQLQINKLTIYQNKNNPYNPKHNIGIKHITQLIKNFDGFKQFILHLLEEFSTENLIFLVELIQIKYSYAQSNNNIILVPRQPIYEIDLNSKTVTEKQKCAPKIATHPLQPSFDVIVHSNSISSASGSSGESEINGTDLFDHGTVSDRKQSATVTPGTNNNNIPGHSNNNSGDNDEIYEDDNKYMTLDFNAVNIINYDMNIHSSSPSPPPPIQIQYNNTDTKIDDLPTNSTVLANRCRSHTVNPDTTENINKLHIRTQSMPKLQGNSTFLARARTRSKSRTFTMKKKKESMYTYLFNTNGNLLMKLQLPPGLPKSAVLTDSVASNNLALEMEYLYNKFIKIDSIHEINLPHFIKSPLIKFFENDKLHLKQKQESFLFNVFDESANSILQLMLDSYHRFVLTDKYKSIAIEMDCMNTPIDMTMSTPQTLNSTPQTIDTTPTININENDINLELPIIRNATSYNKLLMQYQK
eukprot:3792_1